MHLYLYGRSLQGPVHHGQHTALDVLSWGLGQKKIHLLEEDQQDLETHAHTQSTWRTEKHTPSTWKTRTQREFN